LIHFNIECSVKGIGGHQLIPVAVPGRSRDTDDCPVPKARAIYGRACALAPRTSCARFIRRLERNTAVWGFSGDANPESEIAQTFFGHDFALVDSRYIVDPWVAERAGMSERAAFDLEDPRDA
jgi:hypothetical protein